VLTYVTYDFMVLENKTVSVADISKDLVGHAKTFNPNAKRGLVVELFPAIFQASEHMSARGVSKYLNEKHGIKLSAVTITKALNDPKKNWNQFFDIIEPYVEAYENWEKSTKRDEFLFDDESFKAVQFPGREFVRKHLLKFAFAQAINVLREKWFSIDIVTRIKARTYLAERLLRKVK
jgi:hypothetical protein